MTAVEAFAELMTKYNESRAAAIARLGDQFDEKAFHAWFTKQVTG